MLYLSHKELPRNDPEQLERTVTFLERLFREHRNELLSVADYADTLKNEINAVDSFIQHTTAVVCARCKNVCCVNRHGWYDYEDLIYVFALELQPLPYHEGVTDTDPCRFLSPHGCTIERAVRPFRCNWHFCSALVEHLESGPAKPFRLFVNRFQRIIDLRKEMLDRFFTIVTSVKRQRT